MKQSRRPGDGRSAGQKRSVHTRPVSRLKQDKSHGRRYASPMAKKNLDQIGPFALLVRHARTQRGLTQEQLADASGVARSTIIRWETGQIVEPELHQLRAVADVLGILPEDAYRAVGWLPPQSDEIPPPPVELRDHIERRLYERIHDVLPPGDVRRVLTAFRVMRELESDSDAPVQTSG